MFEELYEKLPDLDAYLARLELMKVPNLDLDGLGELIYAHQCQVPFENLDICEKQQIASLKIVDLFQKIVSEQRGGYCFELNALFQSLLTACGFEVFPCMGRIVRGRDYLSPPLHRANLVRLDECLYFCDVGYGGPQPAEGVPLIDGWEGTLRGHTYRMSHQKDSWWLLSQRIQGELVPIISFSDNAMDAVDFIPINYYCSASPDTVFTRFRFLNRRTPDGSVSIFDNMFTHVKDHQKTEREITSDEDFYEILNKYFNLIYE